MHLPDEILNHNDLRTLANCMLEMNISVPIYGHVVKNGEPVPRKYGVARATPDGSDILIDTRNVKECQFDLSTLYPQIVRHLKSTAPRQNL